MTTRPPESRDMRVSGRGGVPDGVLHTSEAWERLAWATYSASGDRTAGINRDAVVAVTRGEEGVFAVADGMGHLKGSENASRIAADQLMALFSHGLEEPRAFGGRVAEMGRAIGAAIREKIELEGGDRSMGTTLTGCAVFGGRYTVYHIGDSRLYHFSGGRLIRRTEDHTRQAEAERTGIRVPEGLPPHQLTRALMYADEKTTTLALYPSDGGTFPLLPGDILIACTDGVHKHLTESDFTAALDEVTDAISLGIALERLALRALANGSTDDRSLTGVYVPGSGVPRGRPGSGVGSDRDSVRRLPPGMLWMALLGALVGLVGLAFVFIPRPQPEVTPSPTPSVEASPTPAAENADASPSPSPSPSGSPDPENPTSSGDEPPPVIGAPGSASTLPPPREVGTPRNAGTSRNTETSTSEPKTGKKTRRGSSSGTDIRLPSVRSIERTIKSHLKKGVNVEITIPKSDRTRETPKPRSTPRASGGDDDPRRPHGQGTTRSEPSKPDRTDDDPRRPRR